MKTIIFSFIFIFITSAYSVAQFAGGSGTIADPYLVSNATQLSNVRNYLDKYFLQTANINLLGYDENADGKGWLPIGGAGTSDSFKGHYDGQNFTISNLEINRPNTNNVGLFGLVGVSNSTDEVVIKNLGLMDVKISGDMGVGSLAGGIVSNKFTLVEYSYVLNGKVSGNSDVGGLIGYVQSYLTTANTIEKPVISITYSFVDVQWLKAKTGNSFGGLIGHTYAAKVENSYSRSSVTVDNSVAAISSISNVGGLIGSARNKTEILNSYSAGIITTLGSPAVGQVGGFIGLSEGNSVIKNSYWDTQSSGKSSSDGGVGKTTVQMKTKSTFLNYDFVNIWGIDANINDGYPYLRDKNNGVLPVSLEYFKASVEENSVALSWKTSSEINNNFFAIERSIDGFKFEEIETISGGGNSNVELYYNVTDLKPFSGISYYRLKQVDFDGTTEYFNIEAVNVEKTLGTFDVYPNPNNGSFIISADADSGYFYSIFDSAGKLVRNGELVDYENAINLDNVSTGVYFVKIKSDTDYLNTTKIIVN